MIASLAWYPATRPIWERLWAGVRGRLGTGPERLTWPEDFDEHWRDPDLLLAMTCARPMQMGLHERVTVVGSPVWDLPDLPPGHYASHLVTRSDDDRPPPRAAVAGVAINGRDSQSGWGTLLAAGLGGGPALVTGSHAGSIRAVAEGRAHLASIDVATWAMTAPPPGLVVRATTPPTPSTPFVTARSDMGGVLHDALAAAIAEMPRTDREATRLAGILRLPEGTYSGPPADA